MRLLQILTLSGPREIAVRNSRQATLLGKYFSAVQKYVSIGDSTALVEFHGKFITDARGVKVPLLTDLKELDRLASAGVVSFESLYSRS